MNTEFPELEWKPTLLWGSEDYSGCDRWQLEADGLQVGRVIKAGIVSRGTGWKAGYWGKSYLSPLEAPDKVFHTLKAAAEYVNNAAKRDFLREEEGRVSK